MLFGLEYVKLKRIMRYKMVISRPTTLFKWSPSLKMRLPFFVFHIRNQWSYYTNKIEASKSHFELVMITSTVNFHYTSWMTKAEEAISFSNSTVVAINAKTPFVCWHCCVDSLSGSRWKRRWDTFRGAASGHLHPGNTAPYSAPSEAILNLKSLHASLCFKVFNLLFFEFFIKKSICPSCCVYNKFKTQRLISVISERYNVTPK